MHHQEFACGTTQVAGMTGIGGGCCAAARGLAIGPDRGRKIRLVRRYCGSQGCPLSWSQPLVKAWFLREPGSKVVLRSTEFPRFGGVFLSLGQVFSCPLAQVVRRAAGPGSRCGPFVTVVAGVVDSDTPLNAVKPRISRRVARVPPNSIANVDFGDFIGGHWFSRPTVVARCFLRQWWPEVEADAYGAIYADICRSFGL
ncbi:Uncharacterised protein [Mycobacteroides abscessus subsp. abscessus]|nr:Uncharacterised protein [Mycobacteroides abscessus subsp. abscessus]SHX83970.1 Uncharacterised protein [Mycobacteroides abscessus subsp. abscessus]SIG23984.1 Uncharacterised protein [Mycobacteroides abscessus subsp. abscessus]SKO49388.1 Uncharacterised protein [Mycobacteroides abscessus subsp. abscessus]SKP32451.1 Uncharacterised protein [Mycobacteroides abscessus subsp. abscessus]